MAYNPEYYIHDLDKKAFAALNAFPKVVKLKELYISNYDEKAAKINFLSEAIRLSPNQMPEIYNLLPPICEKLGIEIPELYYVKSKEVNAATGGSLHPYIYITSELVDKIPSELIASVIAHECGHIASKHYLYHSIAMQLIQGVDNSPLAFIPGVSEFLTPTMVKAFLFWERCSEFSADRAATLCDGGDDKTIEMLLKIHGYDDGKVNKEEFLKQAMDLHDFIDESNANKIIEQMLIQTESHPRLATRVYECHNFASSEKFTQILNGTYNIETEKDEEEEIISAELKFDAQHEANDANVDMVALDAELDRVNQELERYTNHADKFEYAIAVGIGIIAGFIDAVYIGETHISNGDIVLSHKQVNNFIQEYAEKRGIGRDRLKDAIAELEKAFPVLQDNSWSGADIKVSAKNHHLADLAHHPTPLGLVSAIMVQFLRVGTFVNRDGEWHFIFVETSKEDIMKIAIPAMLTGLLNWLVYVNEKDYEDETGNGVPKSIHRVAHIVASTPLIIEIAKCADNWFGHLVSDMGGSKNTAGGGMGIPGVFISLLYEIAAMPGLKETGLLNIVNDLYQNQKIDMRHELAGLQAMRKQALPVLFVELYTRAMYFAAELGTECAEVELRGGTYKDINWKRVVPFNNRSIDRMLLIAWSIVK